MPLPLDLVDLRGRRGGALVVRASSGGSELGPERGGWNRAGWLVKVLVMRVPTMTPELATALGEYRRLLAGVFGSRLVSLRLFGSRARGDADVDSDADVSVVIAALTEPERDTAIDLAYEAWRGAGRVGPLLSPLVWSESQRDARLRGERRIALDIEREGIPI